MESLFSGQLRAGSEDKGRSQKPKKSHKEVRDNRLEFSLFDPDRYAAYVFVWGKCSPFLSVFPVSGRRGLLN